MLRLDSALQRCRSSTHPGSRSSRRRQRPAVDLLEGRQLLATGITTVSVPISPVEGQPFSGIVAKFTDNDGNTNAALYTVVINWGNGHTSTGSDVTIKAEPDKNGNPTNTFDVSGTNTYREEGKFQVAVQIADQDSDQATALTTNIVSDAPLTATGTTVNATVNRTVKNTVVATFTDANPNAKASGFTAKIDWGDGSTSNGFVVPDRTTPHVFDVLGSHRYRAQGAFSITAHIQDASRGVTSTQFFTETNLISDGAVPADHINTNLVNPWGLVASSTSPFWIANNGTGTSTLNDGAGNPFPPGNPLVVTIPSPGTVGTSPTSSQAAPTGIVFNPNNGAPGSGTTSEFNVDQFNTGKNVPSIFIFDTEDGTISAWNPGSTGGPNNAVLEVDNSTQVYPNGGVGAVYKGLALDNNGTTGINGITGDFLYAANFRSGNVDVFDSKFNPITLPAGAFQDPTLPSNATTHYAPFGIQNIGGNLYVTFAKQDADMHDDVAGPGNGFVDVFSPTGTLLHRLGTPDNPSGGPGVPGPQPELNSPWGVVLAPASFGKFGGDILVGNFGDSHISAFDPKTFAFLGQVSDAQGRPIAFTGGFRGTDTKGLWGLSFGNGTTAPANTLFFNSGIDDESHGLFGSITATSLSTTASGVASVVAPVHGHSGSGDMSSQAVAIAPMDPATFQGSGDRQRGHAHDAAIASFWS